MYYKFRQLREQQTTKRGDGGIGRRAGFRCLWWQHRVGSSPILRIKIRYQLIPDFLCSDLNSFLNYCFDIPLSISNLYFLITVRFCIDLNPSFSRLYQIHPFYTNYPFASGSFLTLYHNRMLLRAIEAGNLLDSVK